MWTTTFVVPNVPSTETHVSDILSVFLECLRPLALTHEVAVNNHIRFLDLGLYFLVRRVSWAYGKPRGNKPVLPFESAHSKLVKCGIVRYCFSNALTKSREHRLESAVCNQVSRLKGSCYPGTLLLDSQNSQLPRTMWTTRSQKKVFRHPLFACHL